MMKVKEGFCAYLVELLRSGRAVHRLRLVRVEQQKKTF